MATFKHISSKNANYGDAEKYLTFAHNEFTMKPTLDENGRLVPREDYRISTMNCGEEDFAIACMRSNLRYGKNQKREDVKSHHYIISFDPRDGTDNGLTVDKAQELGEKFCREQFPGHQAIVCTHPDGHNHSGNIHVHIVINSLRIEEVPLLPYMDRPAYTRAGCKHRCTDAAMEYFKSEVMELCHNAGLYQIDLLNGSANRITEREYWAGKKGQLAIDRENEKRLENREPLIHTKFETDKEKLRQTIRAALSSAVSFDDFTGKLLQQGVTVRESRGRLSYLTPTARSPSRRGSWGTILTAPPFLPLWSKTPIVPFLKPLPRSRGLVFPRQSGAWWILKPREPRARVSDMRSGRRFTTSSRWRPPLPLWSNTAIPRRDWTKPLYLPMRTCRAAPPS